MRARSECHARIDLNDFFAGFRLIRFPSRFDNDTLADLGRFEIGFPIVFPLAVVFTADLGLEGAEVDPVPIRAARRLFFQFLHRCADLLRLRLPLFVVVQIDCDFRRFVLEFQHAVIDIVPLITFLFFEQIVDVRRIFHHRVRDIQIHQRRQDQFDPGTLRFNSDF